MCQLVLTSRQIWDMLAQTRVAYMATCMGDTPYIVPLWYQLDKSQENPSVCVQLCAGGTMAKALCDHPRVCMAFSWMDKRWIDSALLWGDAEVICDAKGLLTFRIVPYALSGRRFMLKK